MAEANTLKKNSLGTGAITFLVISAAAPLTAVAAGVPISMLLGNGAGIAGSFAIVTAILLVFAAGYCAMARHVPNAGAFYAFTAQGLGGRAGGAAALVAILSYNAMQIGVMGLLGAAASGTFAQYGIDLQWWVWSLIFIGVVAVFGYRQVDLSAKVLIVLVALEYLIVVIIDAAILVKGGDAGLSMAPFSWRQIMSGVPSVGILFCFAAFIGFEATTIYSEEAKDPRVAIPKATYASVILIGGFYMVTAWLIACGAGVDKLVPMLQGMDPTRLLFNLSDQYVGGPVSTVMEFLFLSSLFAAVLAFHNAIARYTYVAGREGLLPDSFGVTHAQHQSPHVGSIIQTMTAAILIGVFAFLGLDPVLQVFTWLTQLGTLGVLGLMAVTSFSVIAFFTRRPELGETMMSTKVLPTLSGLAMAALFVVIFMQFGALTGAVGALSIILPSLVLVAAVIGFVLASGLSGRDPGRFARLGNAR